MSNKMTLLEMTQNIMSALDSDDVNSINDTVESLQVAEVIKETFFEITAGLEVPEHNELLQLDGLADENKPNYLLIPNRVKKIKWIKYNTAGEGGTPNYRGMRYLDKEEFVEYVLPRWSHDENISYVEDFNGVKFPITNNKAPQYWTTFDDEHLVFDSYDLDVETTLHASRSMAFCWMIPRFIMSDDFIPDLDEDMFPLFLSEAKGTCFINLKQVSSAKAEQISRRQRVRMQNDQWRADQGKHAGPNYGRARKRSTR
jgi:hypothetical protein